MLKIIASIMENSIKSIKGITLVSLVVTIIVLLILAGVSIGLVFNSDGLFSKANDSAIKYEEAKENEKEEIEQLDKHLQNIHNNIDNNSNNEDEKRITADLVSFTPEDSNWDVENVKEALDYLYNN